MLLGNLTNYPYSGNRKLAMGLKGAVATSQPLAAIAGMEMLWAGGNAVDAAIATSIALTVVEPTSNGIGSDAFAIVWDGKLHGLNASGKSPQSLTFDKCVGLNRLPLTDWRSVTVPGAVSAWRALSSRWGRLPFEKLFAPAIRYAEEGFPVSPITSLTERERRREEENAGILSEIRSRSQDAKSIRVAPLVVSAEGYKTPPTWLKVLVIAWASLPHPITSPSLSHFFPFYLVSAVRAASQWERRDI